MNLNTFRFFIILLLTIPLSTNGMETGKSILDPELPDNMQIQMIEGEQYEAEVPATLDLSLRAELALNNLMTCPRYVYHLQC